jgi:hypothetical protein
MRLQLRTRITQDLLYLRGGIKIGDRNWGEEKSTGPELRGQNSKWFALEVQKNSWDLNWGDKNPSDLHWRYKKNSWDLNCGYKTHRIWNEGKRNSWVSKGGGQKFSGPPLRGQKTIETYIEGTKFTWSELRVGQSFTRPELKGQNRMGPELRGTKNSQVLLCSRGQTSQDLKWGDKITHRTICIEGTSFLGFLSPQFAGPELRWQETRHLKSPHHHAVCSCSRVREGVSLSLSLSRSRSLFPAIPCKSFLSRTQFGDRLQLLYAQLQSQNAHQTAQCRKQLISK